MFKVNEIMQNTAPLHSMYLGMYTVDWPNILFKKIHIKILLIKFTDISSILSISYYSIIRLILIDMTLALSAMGLESPDPLIQASST